MSPPSSTAPSSWRRDRVTIDTARGWELTDKTPTDFDRKMNAIQDNKHIRRLIETVESTCSPDVLQLVYDSIRDTDCDQSAYLPDYSVYKEPLRKLHTAVRKYKRDHSLDKYEEWSLDNVVTEAKTWIGKNSKQRQVEGATSSTKGGNEGA